MTFYPEDVLLDIITSLCKDTKTRDTALLALEAYPSIELPEEFGDLIDRDKLLDYHNYVYIEDGLTWELDYEAIKVPTIRKAPTVVKNSKLLYWWEEPFKEKDSD